jgi:hypothetical protein
LAVDPEFKYPKIAEIAGINQRERTPAPNLKENSRELKERAASMGGLKPAPLVF